MIPEFTSDGFLPVGHHHAEWDEFVARYSTNIHREDLLEGIHQILTLLANAGCTEVRMGGSFVTAKERPRDFDGLWIMEGVDDKKLPLEVAASYQAQEDIFRGTIYPGYTQFTDIGHFIEVIEQNKKGVPVGIVIINPQRVPPMEPYPLYKRYFEKAA